LIIIIWPQFSEMSSNFDEILLAAADYDDSEILQPKLKTFIFKMVHGCNVENVAFSNNSAAVCPIFAKLYMITQNRKSVTVECHRF